MPRCIFGRLPRLSERRNLHNPPESDTTASEAVMTITQPVNIFARIRNAAWVRILMMAALALAGILLFSNLPFISAQEGCYV